MSLSEVNSYEDLERYIKKEIARMTAEKIAVELRLNDKWFVKLAKLVSFSMKNNESEKVNKQRLQEDCTRFAIRINTVGVIVIKHHYHDSNSVN